MGRVELNESVTMIRRILSVFFPIFASNSIGTVMLLIDRILIGHAGPQSLSAVVGAAWFLVFLQMFPNGILSYTTAMVANSRGAGRDADCSLICTQSCLVGIASYICLIALLPIEIRFFGIFGMDEAIVILEKQFFIICVLGSLFGLLGIALGGYFIGTKRPSNVTWSTLIAATTTILLDYVLIFGNLGFPKLGVKGAAIATTVGNLFATAWLLFLYLRKSNAEPFRVVDSFRFSPFLLKKLMKLGAPLGIEQVVYVGTSAVFFQLFFSYGKDAAAALSAVSSVDSVVFMPFLSMMITVMTLVGTEMGNGNAEKGRKYSLSALCVALVIAVVPASLYLVVPQWLVRNFLCWRNMPARPFWLSQSQCLLLQLSRYLPMPPAWCLQELCVVQEIRCGL